MTNLKQAGSIQVEVYPVRLFSAIDREYMAWAFGLVAETSLENVTWWDLWSLSFRFPFLRHKATFVIDD